MVQQTLLALKHESRQRKRLKKFDRVNPERIYAARWKVQMRQSISSGGTFLEHLLCDDDGRPQPVSLRDAVVAASVIQWLGTPCGLGFIRGCERRIDGAHRTADERRARPSLLALERGDITETRRAVALRGLPT